MRNDTKAILEAVQKGEMTVEEALLFLKKAPFEDIGYAKVDSHRAIRQGVAEVIFGAGKTAEQMIGIVEQMKKNGQQTILLTRLSEESAEQISAVYEMDYHKDAKIGLIGSMPAPNGIGKIVVATGGTSDIPVAEEAALTAEVLLCAGVYALQIILAPRLRSISFAVEFPVSSVAVALAALLLSRLLGESKQLKEDNDLFV